MINCHFKGVCKFRKIDKISLASFHFVKNGENLKILKNIFCQKLIVSHVILAFLDPFSKSLDSPLDNVHNKFWNGYSLTIQVTSHQFHYVFQLKKSFSNKIKN